MAPNYLVVVVLPSRQIKRVARPTVCNYERCVICDVIFRMRNTADKDYKHLVKSIKDQNTRCDSICRPTYQSMRGVTATALCN